MWSFRGGPVGGVTNRSGGIDTLGVLDGPEIPETRPESGRVFIIMDKSGTVFFVYHNGENDSYREEMRWCRCYDIMKDKEMKIEDVKDPDTLG